MQTDLTILLAGYGWFASIPEGETNNAQMIAEALDRQTLAWASASGRRATATVHSLVVPVTWEGAFPPVQAAIEALQPDIVLALGTAAGLEAMRPEPFGVNWMEGRDADPADHSRETNKNEPIDPTGPAYERGSLPYERMALTMLEAGIPAYVGSLQEEQTGDCAHRCTAGAYLCNYMAYRLPRLIRERDSRAIAGFMHVPTQPKYAAAWRLRQLDAGASREKALTEPLFASMPLEVMIEGTRAALLACCQEFNQTLAKNGSPESL